MSRLYIFLFLLFCSPVFGQTKIHYAEAISIYIPNLITMDCEYGEDYFFKIYADCEFTEFELIIFNRWGEVMFTTTDINIRWCAEACPDGTYIYKLKGTCKSGQTVSKTGHVTVLK